MNFPAEITQLYLLSIFLSLGLVSCSNGVYPKPFYQVNNLFASSSTTYSQPDLGFNWLAIIVKKKGKEKIQLVNLKTRKMFMIPTLNNSNTKLIGVSISSNGKIVALITKNLEEYQLLIYNRNIERFKRLELDSKGIPLSVSIDGLGNLLAVEIQINGRRKIEIIRL